MLFISGDFIEDDDVDEYVKTFAPEAEVVILNNCSRSMSSDFRYYNNKSELLCHVIHTGEDNDVNDLQINGRLPEGGQAIVDKMKEQQKGETAVDYLWSVPELLAESLTGYRAEGTAPVAELVNGFHLLKGVRN